MTGDRDDDRLDALTALMREAGAADPAVWARSEVREDIAQAARYAFLRAVWRNLERWREPDVVDRLLADLALTDEVRHELRGRIAQAAFEATQDVVHVIDDGWDDEGPEAMPGWRLMEVDPDTEDLTGREVGSVHESVLEVDPAGIEAADIRGW